MRPIPVECAQEAALHDAAAGRSRPEQDFKDQAAWVRYKADLADYRRQFAVDARWAARPPKEHRP